MTLIFKPLSETRACLHMPLIFLSGDFCRLSMNRSLKSFTGCVCSKKDRQKAHYYALPIQTVTKIYYIQKIVFLKTFLEFSSSVLFFHVEALKGTTWTVFGGKRNHSTLSNKTLCKNISNINISFHTCLFDKNVPRMLQQEGILSVLIFSRWKMG